MSEQWGGLRRAVAALAVLALGAGGAAGCSGAGSSTVRRTVRTAHLPAVAARVGYTVGGEGEAASGMADPAPWAVTTEYQAQPWSMIPLVHEGMDHLELEPDGPTFVVRAAPGNRGANTRVVVLPAGERTIDQQICATWSDARGRWAQPGLALKVAEIGSDRYRAVTVTENVAFLQTWVINVHGWDTAANAVGTLLGQSAVWSLALVPLPWRVCARVEGDRLDVKAWALSTPEPTWGESLHALSVRLPPEFAGPGQAGWYAGHLTPGDEVRYRDTTIWGRWRDSWPTDRLRSLS